jgi:beta-galactosidase
MSYFNLHNTFTLQDKAEVSRSYYIPFANDSFDLDLTKSSQMFLLNKWRFAYYERLTDDILLCEPKHEINVPSCWQMLGYDFQQYSNMRYPFPYTPPVVLKDIPCGLYVTDYVLSEKTGDFYLNFDGVDCCYYIFINGEYSGFSTVAHSHAEFNITDKLIVGNNEIKVVVLKWGTASYLECQDKFRMSGIFREVYILQRPKNHIRDYKIEGNGKNKIFFNSDREATVCLYDKDILIGQKVGKNIIFNVSDAKLWNAENPYLYRLVISCAGEFIEEKIGIRRVHKKIAHENS